MNIEGGAITIRPPLSQVNLDMNGKSVRSLRELEATNGQSARLFRDEPPSHNAGIPFSSLGLDGIWILLVVSLEQLTQNTAETGNI